jgi:hypothetical protein
MGQITDDALGISLFSARPVDARQRVSPEAHMKPLAARVTWELAL